MSKINLLDCTLRDGGYVNDCISGARQFLILVRRSCWQASNILRSDLSGNVIMMRTIPCLMEMKA